MRHFRIWVLLPFFLMESLFLVCRAQGSYPKEVEENISKVEKGLTGWVKTPDGDWTIQERMDFYRIPGVTIGVIRNYKLEWAKGYGYADTSDKRPVTTQTLFQARTRFGQPRYLQVAGHREYRYPTEGCRTTCNQESHEHLSRRYDLISAIR